MDLLKTIEEWAKKYKPMQHDPEQNRRVFFCDGDFGFRDVLQHAVPEQSPFVMLDSEVNVNMSARFNDASENIFFVVRCTDMVDDSALYRANREALEHARRFYSYALRNASPEDKRLVDFDKVHISSYNIGFDGWTSAIMTIQKKEQTDLCADEGYYVNN